MGVSKLKVLLVDDHPLYRQGLRILLESINSIEVVGEAGDGVEALSLTDQLSPDLVIMDITMPGQSGLEATRQLKEYYPQIKVIMLSGYADNVFVDQALKAGAEGYVYKDAAYDEISIAIDAVKKERPYLSPAVLQPVVKSYLQSTPAEKAINEYDKLTDREKEIFMLLVRGRSRTVIAGTLNISPKTVDRHRSNLFKKLGLNKEKELKEFALNAGLIDQD